METKTSRIKDIQGNGSWTHQQHGLFFSHEYTFEDGVTMTANSKSEISPFKINEEVEYIVKQESEQYGKSGKIQKPQEQFQSGQKSDKVQVYIIRQSSLTRAIEHLTVLNNLDGESLTKESVVSLADYYVNYVLNGK